MIFQSTKLDDVSEYRDMCSWFLSRSAFPDNAYKLSNQQLGFMQVLSEGVSLRAPNSRFGKSCLSTLTNVLDKLGDYVRGKSYNYMVNYYLSIVKDCRVNIGARLILLRHPPISFGAGVPSKYLDKFVYKLTKIMSKLVRKVKSTDCYLDALTCLLPCAVQPSLTADAFNKVYKKIDAGDLDFFLSHENYLELPSKVCMDQWLVLIYERCFYDRYKTRRVVVKHDKRKFKKSFQERYEKMTVLCDMVKGLQDKYSSLLKTHFTGRNPYAGSRVRSALCICGWEELYERSNWITNALCMNTRMEKALYSLLHSDHDSIVRIYHEDAKVIRSGFRLSLSQWFGKCIAWFDSIMGERGKTFTHAQREIISNTLRMDYGGRFCRDVEKTFTPLFELIADPRSRYSKRYRTIHDEYMHADDFESKAAAVCQLYCKLKGTRYVSTAVRRSDSCPHVARKRHCIWYLLTQNFTQILFVDPFANNREEPVYFFKFNSSIIMVRRNCRSSIYFFSDSQVTIEKMTELALFAHVGMLQLATATPVPVSSSSSSSGTTTMPNNILPNSPKYDRLLRASTPVLGRDWVDQIRNVDLSTRYGCLATKWCTRSGSIHGILYEILRLVGVSNNTTASSWVTNSLDQFPETSQELGFNGQSQLEWEALHKTKPRLNIRTVFSVIEDDVLRVHSSMTSDGKYECCVCYAEHLATECVVTCKNLHYVCKDCMNQLYEHCNDLTELRCPQCRNKLPLCKDERLSTYMMKFGLEFDQREEERGSKRKSSLSTREASKKSKTGEVEVIVIE